MYNIMQLSIFFFLHFHNDYSRFHGGNIEVKQEMIYSNTHTHIPTQTHTRAAINRLQCVAPTLIYFSRQNKNLICTMGRSFIHGVKEVTVLPYTPTHLTHHRIYCVCRDSYSFGVYTYKEHLH